MPPGDVAPNWVAQSYVNYTFGALNVKYDIHLVIFTLVRSSFVAAPTSTDVPDFEGDRGDGCTIDGLFEALLVFHAQGIAVDQG